jgi:hypothetical protein
MSVVVAKFVEESVQVKIPQPFEFRPVNDDSFRNRRVSSCYRSSRRPRAKKARLDPVNNPLSRGARVEADTPFVDKIDAKRISHRSWPCGKLDGFQAVHVGWRYGA